jgi:hypothetical protein
MPTLSTGSICVGITYHSFQRSRFDIYMSFGLLVQFSAFEFFAGNFDRIMSVTLKMKAQEAVKLNIRHPAHFLLE